MNYDLVTLPFCRNSMLWLIFCTFSKVPVSLSLVHIYPPYIDPKMNTFRKYITFTQILHLCQRHYHRSMLPAFVNPSIPHILCDILPRPKWMVQDNATIFTINNKVTFAATTQLSISYPNVKDLLHVAENCRHANLSLIYYYSKITM